MFSHIFVQGSHSFAMFAAHALRDVGDPYPYGVPFVSKLLFNRCLAETLIFSKGIDV